jgi:hypothetical protein
MNLRPFAFLVLYLLPACGGSSDPRALADEGSKALNSGKYEEAAASYERALAAIGSDTGNPEWKRAKMGLIQARVHLDAGRAKDDFLQLASAGPGKITDSDFNLIGSKLGDAGKLKEATEVLTAGMQAHPESPHLKALMDDIGKRAEASGDESTLASLKGLGYVGD